MEAIIGLVGVVIGAILTFLIGSYQDWKKEKRASSNAAALLYHDLKSIEDYLQNEAGNVNF